MIRRSFAELVTDLRMRRTVGDKPPVLLLGAGASIDAGIGAMPELFEFFGCTDFESFCKYIDTTTAAERYRYLADFLQTRRPAQVSPGYRALATLCAHNYFDLVLTTNMDPLLDDALSAARLWRRDYLLIVNGVIRPDRLPLLLSGQSPRVKIVKLHGDLFQRFMAWTVPEMDTFLTEVSPHLKPAVADRDFIIVGYSLRDQRVRELVESSGGSVWFTHPTAVPDHLKDNKSIRAVLAPECAFESFFPSLAKALQVPLPKEPLDAAKLELGSAAPVGAEAQTMDDLMSATLAIAGPDGIATSTAFLIAEPRVIVCDRFASDPYIVNGAVDVIASSGHRFSTRVIDVDTSHEFGPIVLEAPDALQAPGLRLAAGAVQTNAVVQILVSAGTKTGISTGKVTKARLEPISIAPIAGRVRNLAELECVVAPGASGAPVVDATPSVCGFIVAGSSDPQDPRSFAYPAQHWASFLEGDQSGQPNQVVDD
jgi:SIR2-like domain